MTSRTVFYVWQGDTPAQVGSDLIERALQTAIADVSNALGMELRLDRDTRGIPGTPDIISTILKKIQQSMVLVADLTIVARIERDGASKGTPNPNVMMEFGFALEAIGWERIITVFNQAFGAIRDLPFDIAGRRMSVLYSLPPHASDTQLANAEKMLAAELRERIREVATAAAANASDDDFSSAFETSAMSFLAASRIGHVSQDDGTELDVFWKNGPQAFLRLIPRSPLQINSRVELKNAAVGGDPVLESLGRWRTGRHVQNEWGFAVLGDLHIERETTFPWNFSQLFRTGELWGIDQRMLRANERVGDQHYIPSRAMEELFDHGLQNFLEVAQRRLALAAPVKVVAGLGFVQGLRLARGNSFSDPCVDNSVIHDQVFEAFDVNAHSILVPFYRRVWDAFGEEYPT